MFHRRRQEGPGREVERGEDGAGVVRRVSLWAVTATNSGKPPPTPCRVSAEMSSISLRERASVETSQLTLVLQYLQ